MRVGIAQIAPVVFDREATTAKAVVSVRAAAGRGASLIAFGEALIPAYPFWISRTDGARFEAEDQKELYALYADRAIVIDAGHLDQLRDAAREGGIAVVVGVAERDPRRGHSVFCSRVFIGADGEILSVHRKLMPTHEERLAWASGDAHGLVTHRVGAFTVGALNCWENWMPLARAALYGQGEDLHVMLWPGCLRLTRDITRFVARELRGYVVSASAIIRAGDVPADVPHRDRMVSDPSEVFYDGGSCIAGPDGEWIVEPVVGREELIIADLDPECVRRERQSFDPAGHYARPEILRLVVDRSRRSPTEFG